MKRMKYEKRENYGKGEIVLLCCVLELAVILSVSAANLFRRGSRFDDVMYAVFYNLLYGIGVSVLMPLLLLVREGNDLTAAGVKKIGRRQIIVFISFVAFSVGGQIIPKLAGGEILRTDVLPVAVLPLIMTTFFEEFLFRGFCQMRLEKKFGSFTAVVISGLLFSLYHLGYPGFRTFGDILLLFAVGIGFALSFTLSDNNLIVAYFVNLPNAFITYILKYEQFPVMTAVSSVYAGITIVLVGVLIFIIKKGFWCENGEKNMGI